MTFGRPSTAERQAQRAAERERNLCALLQPPKALHRGSYEGGVTAAPKTKPQRNATLLEMARGRPCLMDDPVICDHSRQPEDTVAAHSNFHQHGKSGSRKADDQYSVWMCHCAHSWLDQGRASADEKERRFALAHVRQVLAWRLITMDPNEPEHFRKAARWALERLNATSVGELP